MTPSEKVKAITRGLQEISYLISDLGNETTFILDTDSKFLTSEEIEQVNAISDMCEVLYLHLWMNGFHW